MLVTLQAATSNIMIQFVTTEQSHVLKKSKKLQVDSLQEVMGIFMGFVH